MKPSVWDMHVHLDFMNNADEIVKEAEELGLGLFSVTVTPQGYMYSTRNIEEKEHVCLGVGLHPWWAADGRCSSDDAFLAADLIRDIRFVGEIGLDNSPKHVSPDSLPAQLSAFQTICKACAASASPSSPKILSIHSVRAAGLSMDMLEESGCFSNCRCIFHWFTGSSDELNRAIRSGFMFSVNEMMLNTRRGREYARQIPADRLLLETDLPPGEHIPFSALKILESLERSLDILREIRGMDMRRIICENSERILS